MAEQGFAVSRRMAVAFLSAFVGLLLIAMARATVLRGAVLEPHHGDGHIRRFGRGMVSFDRAGPERWSFRYRREHRAVKNLAAVVRRQRRQLARLQPPRRSTQSASTGQSVPAVICVVFPDCAKALSVARCESGYSVTARNGQYFGVFQMGTSERARFGGSTTDPWDQVRAAYAYFRVAGWSPWQCA